MSVRRPRSVGCVTRVPDGAINVRGNYRGARRRQVFDHGSQLDHLEVVWERTSTACSKQGPTTHGAPVMNVYSDHAQVHSATSPCRSALTWGAVRPRASPWRCKRCLGSWTISTLRVDRWSSSRPMTLLVRSRSRSRSRSRTPRSFSAASPSSEVSWHCSPSPLLNAAGKEPSQ